LLKSRRFWIGIVISAAFLAVFFLQTETRQTSVTEAISIGQTQVSVEDAADFQVEDVIKIGSGESIETKVITAIDWGNNSITADSGFSSAHSINESVITQKRVAMEMGEALAKANYLYLIPAIAVYFLGVWFRAVRWRYILLTLGKFNISYLFRQIMIGFTLNNLIPGRLGILLRAYMIGEKYKVSKVAVGATVGIERVFDGIVLVLFLMIISFFVTLQKGDVTYWLEVLKWGSIGIFLFCLLALMVITFKPDIIRRIGRAVIRRLPSKSKFKWDEWLEAGIVGLSIPRQPGRLFAISVTSILVWICEGSTFYIISLGFDINLPFHAMLLVMCIATLSWFILIAPGGIGTFDWFGRETLVALGVPISTASAAILLIHATVLLPVIPLGLLFLWLEDLSLAKVVRRKVKLSGDPASKGSEQ
jgi:uncharacterized protein (TIRG00374 family)